jgi:hypothetical protein
MDDKMLTAACLPDCLQAGFNPARTAPLSKSEISIGMTGRTSETTLDLWLTDDPSGYVETQPIDVAAYAIKDAQCQAPGIQSVCGSLHRGYTISPSTASSYRTDKGLWLPLLASRMLVFSRLMSPFPLFRFIVPLDYGYRMHKVPPPRVIREGTHANFPEDMSHNGSGTLMRRPRKIQKPELSSSRRRDPCPFGLRDEAISIGQSGISGHGAFKTSPGKYQRIPDRAPMQIPSHSG